MTASGPAPASGWIGPDDCAAINPRLIFARSPVGQDGPLASTAGHDINYVADRRVIGAGLRDRPPMPPLNLVADFGGGSNPPTEAAGTWPIVVGTGLTFNDAQTTGKHSDVAREVLDMMWTVQRADGGWNWPHCDYAPMEIDDHYGVTIAALTVGIALVITRKPHSLARDSKSCGLISRTILPSRCTIAPCWPGVRSGSTASRPRSSANKRWLSCWPFNSMMAVGPRPVSSPIGRGGSGRRQAAQHQEK